MKIQCTNCGEAYEGTIARKGSGWYSVCPHCKKESEYEIPDKKIVMIFSDDTGDDYEEFFTNEVKEGTRILSVYTYDTEEEFVKDWLRIKEDPDSMWYWIFKDGEQICSGACDPDDIQTFFESFEDYVWLEATDRCFYINKEWLRKVSTEAAYKSDLFEGKFHFDLFLERCSPYEASRYYGKAKEEGAILYEYSNEENNKITGGKNMKNEKKFFRIPVYWTEYGTVEIEANDLDEAIEIAQTDGSIELPDGNYVDDSWRVDAEAAYAIN